MAVEIERKFLLKTEHWRSQVIKTYAIQQAYFCNTDKASLRIRIRDQQAFLSSKSMTMDISRHEFEYQVPLADAEFMIQNMCQGSAIIKHRHLIPQGNHCWEIDEFSGDNEGLVVAEIELNHVDDKFSRPDWLGSEVSDDPRYINLSLVSNPYKNWMT